MAIPTDFPTALQPEARKNSGNDADIMSEPPMHDTANGNEPAPPSGMNIASLEAEPQSHAQQDLFLVGMKEIELIGIADQDQWLELMSHC
jgi:hypothetical protein